MQQQVRTTVIFGAIVALASGLTGAYASGLFVDDGFEASSLTQTSFMTGHLELTVRDADGIIQAYRQSDNIIVDSGEDCAAMLLFGRNGTAAAPAGTSTTACWHGTESFDVIAIGNRTGSADDGATANNSDDLLFNEHNATANTIGFERTRVAAPVFTAAGAGTAASVVLSNDFTLNAGPLSTTSAVVDESGLFNSTTALANGMFAHQTFSAVTVDNTESLTVEWTINIGGTGTLTEVGEEN